MQRLGAVPGADQRTMAVDDIAEAIHRRFAADAKTSSSLPAKGHEMRTDPQ